MIHQRFTSGGATEGRAASALNEADLRTIPVEQLIAPDFVSFSRQLLSDGVLDIYLHKSAGPVQVSGGIYGAQTIQTLAMDEAFQAFYRDAMARLDAEIDLDIRFVDQPEQADLRFYLDSEISVGGDGVTLGIALSNDTPGKDFWEIMLNAPAFRNDLSYFNYGALHEVLHVLGGEHPFDKTDGDVFVSSNSSSSAYPEETLLAYRNPLGESWPTWFTANDLAFLKSVWGVETGQGVTAGSSSSSGDRLIGTAFDDVLTGGVGTDLLRGESGNDVLTGGGAADELWGGLGSNQFFSGADRAADWLLISRDGSSRMGRNRRSVDEIAELGPEDQIGILGASTSRLRFKSTSIKSTAYGPLEGIGIYVGKRLEAIYTGSDLSLSELKDLTVGLAASYSGGLG